MILCCANDVINNIMYYLFIGQVKDGGSSVINKFVSMDVLLLQWILYCVLYVFIHMFMFKLIQGAYTSSLNFSWVSVRLILNCWQYYLTSIATGILEIAALLGEYVYHRANGEDAALVGSTTAATAKIAGSDVATDGDTQSGEHDAAGRRRFRRGWRQQQQHDFDFDLSFLKLHNYIPVKNK